MTPYLIKGSILFIAINTFLYMLQRFLAPLVRLLPKLSQRYHFERKNLADPFARPWPSDTAVAWAFHCSSEGEFEQLKPMIQSCLATNQKIELIFTSPSVERRVSSLAQEFPAQVRILRLCLLLGLRLKSWSKAQSLVMCRYDFFPELLLLPVKKRVLTWASLKGKNPGLWQKSLYHHFDLVVASTGEQFDRFSEFIATEKLACYDFRPQQINSRLKGAKHESDLTRSLNLVASRERLILGSVWENDLFLLEELMHDPGKIHFWLAPHALDPASIASLEKAWGEYYPQCKLLVFGEDEAIDQDKVAWLVTKPGRLLELYGQFNIAYVGGGFGRSIHSVLEPTLAGCWSACGPRTHRSTEIDLANELSPGQVSVVRDAREFLLWWRQHRELGSSLKDDNRTRSIHNWLDQSEPMLRRCLAN